MSLENIKTGKSQFFDGNNEFGMSKVFGHWMAGLVKYASECTYFLAPYINSYKRLQPSRFEEEEGKGGGGGREEEGKEEG